MSLADAATPEQQPDERPTDSLDEKTFQRNAGRFVDLLVGRLAYESVQLDLLREAIQVCPPERFAVIRDHLDREVTHLSQLRRIIQGLGGDPSVPTAPARLTEKAYQSILRRLKPKSYDALIQALLEFARNTKHIHWEGLIQMARHAGQSGLQKEFRGFREEERRLLAELATEARIEDGDHAA